MWNIFVGARGALRRAVAVGFGLLFLTPAFALKYDLAGDWKNGDNPNGPWSYRQGSIVLPYTPDNFVPGGGFPCPQGAYQPGTGLGGWLPALFKLNCDFGSIGHTGEVMLHTVDPFNGNPANGPANFLFTAPVAGTFDIAGSVGGQIDQGSRPQEWKLLLNGRLLGSGVIGAGMIDPQPFLFRGMALIASDQVELDVFMNKDSCCGNFIHASLTIASAVPEPTPSHLMLIGVVASIAASRCNGRTRKTQKTLHAACL